MRPYLRFRLRVRPERGNGSWEAVLPAALVRRVLGKALIDAFCPFGEPRCQAKEAAGGTNEPRLTPQDHCHLAELCPYGCKEVRTLRARETWRSLKRRHSSSLGSGGLNTRRRLRESPSPSR